MSTLYGKQKILSLQFLILLINIFTLFSSLNLLNLKFLNFKHHKIRSTFHKALFLD